MLIGVIIMIVITLTILILNKIILFCGHCFASAHPTFYNPVKHGYAKSVKDWKYSSFHKFVKNGLYDINWGSNTDIKEIIDLDFE